MRKLMKVLAENQKNGQQLTEARYLATATSLGLSRKEAMLMDIATVYGIHDLRFPRKED